MLAIKIFLFSVLSSLKNAHHLRELNPYEQLIGESPDLVAEYENEGMVSLLEAFHFTRSNHNVNISQWYSMGRPELVKSKSSQISQVFSRDVFAMTHQGFYILVDLLTENQKMFLLSQINSKYNIQADKSQILRIVPDWLECKIELFCGPISQSIHLKGTARYLRQFPIRVGFMAPLKSEKRRCFETHLIENQEVEIKCELKKRSRLPSVLKHLTIPATDFERTDLVERLFGAESSSILIGPQQLDLLVDELFVLVVNRGEFNLTNDEFRTELFQTDAFSSSSFEHLSYGQAFDSLSKYGIDSSEEFEPELRLADFRQASPLLQDSTRDVSNRSIFYMFGGLKSRNYAIEHGLFQNLFDKTNDLNRLNGFVIDLIKWKKENSFIVAESVNVSRIWRASFLSGIEFENVVRKKTKERDSIFKFDFLVRTQGNPEEPYTIIPNMFVNNSLATEIRSIHSALDLWSSCFKTCNQHPNCHFVDFKSTNSCDLYDRSAHFATQETSTSMPFSEAKALFHRNKFQKQYVEGVHLMGRPLKGPIENQMSEDNCWDECLRTKNCVAVTFSTSNSSCYLFKKGSYQVADDLEFVSVGFESERIGEVNRKKEKLDENERERIHSVQFSELN